MNKATIDNSELKVQLMINFLKLMSKFMHLYYDTIKEWEEYPTENDINDEVKFTRFIKKINISIDIILKKAKSADHQHIGRVLLFTKKLLESSYFKSDMTKLNLLTNNSIILLQLVIAKTDEENKQVIFQYISTIIKNFNVAYKHTYASLIEIIANNLALHCNISSFFDYEEFFITEDKYLKSIISQIEIEMSKLNNTFEEDIVGLFSLNNIDYSNDLDLLYIINVLFELKDFANYKSTYSKEEYEDYKKKIQQKLNEEWQMKAKEYEKEKEKKKKEEHEAN